MAFDKNRKFKWCVFCGRPGKLTAEDIFGTKLAERYPVEQQWMSVGQTGTLIHGGGPITRVAPRLACRRCNNETLSRIVDDSLDAVMRLIEGTPHDITPQDRAVLSRNFERMGLIADVMTSNCQLTARSRAGSDYKASAKFRQAPPVYSDAQRKAWIDGGKLPGMHVYIGFHSGVIGLNPYVNSLQIQHAKRFVATIGNLSFCIWMDAAPLPVPNSFRDLAIDAQNWDWPGTVPLVSYEDFFGLYHQDPLHVAMIQLMNDDELRPKVEAYSRQKKCFDLPEELKPQFDRMFIRAML